MQSKISYFKGKGNRMFNPGVWWKDVISFWPLWIVEFLLLQVVTVFPVVNQMNIMLQEYNTEQRGVEMCRLFHVAVSTGSYVLLIAAMSIFVAVFVFGYLNNSRSAYMLHSLPISRTTYFATHFLSGLSMLFVPFAITYGILWGIGIRYHLGMHAVVLGNLLTTFLVILFFYSLSCVVVMLSGNGIMSLVIYGVLNVLEMGFCILLEVVSEQFLYAGTFELELGILDAVCTPVLGFVKLFQNKAQYYMGISARLFPGVMGDRIVTSFYEEEGDYQKMIESLQAVDWKSIGFCLLSLAVTAVFLLIAVRLYQKRSLERVGDLVAFGWCKPIFKAVFCACGSLLFICLFSVLFSGWIANITYENQRFVCAFFLLLGCVISYLIGDMILAKSFSIWKKLSWVQMVIFCGVMFIVVGANYFWDYNCQLHIENEEQTAYVSIRVGSNSFLYTSEEYESLGLGQIRQDIVREGQRLAPADTGRIVGYSVDDDMTLLVDYVYLMDSEDNRRVSYTYYVNEEKQEELVKSLEDTINSADDMAAVVFTKAYESAECEAMEVRKLSEDETLYYIENEAARERVFRAFLKDLQEGNFPFENWGRYGCFDEEGIALYFQTEISEGKLKEIGLPEELWWEYSNNNEFIVAVTEEMEYTWKAVQGLKESEKSESLDEEGVRTVRGK